MYGLNVQVLVRGSIGGVEESRLQTRGVPVAGEQSLNAAGRVRVDLRQDVTQIGERMDPAELAAGRQAVDHRRPAAAVVMTAEQPVLTVDRAGTPV